MIYNKPPKSKYGVIDVDVLLDNDLSPNAHRLYVVLHYMPVKEDVPDIELAESLGISVRQLIKLRNELKRKELLSIQRNGKIERIVTLGNSEVKV